MASTNTLTFEVTRRNPRLIPPAEPTPYEFKSLSDIDDRDALRCQVPMIHFYRNNPSMEGKNPANIIGDAVAKALVFYYPLAGRLREAAGRKLVVECTGQGVVFVAADADVMLHQFGDSLLHPPFPNLEELLFHVPGSTGIIDSPLLTIRVTRLRCGGFILAYRFNHTICDGAGIFQFMSAVGELARGAAVPSIPPVWQRHLLSGRRPVHSKDETKSPILIPLDKMVQRAFFFGATDISALRRSLPPHLQSCSKFEAVAACAWRCWTIAVSPKPDEEIRFACPMDLRQRMKPPLPAGYYGNAIVAVEAVTTAEKLTKYPLHYAVELLRKAKHEATHELCLVAPRFTAGRVYVATDVTHMGCEKVDLGWGTAAYGGVAKGINDSSPALVSRYIQMKDERGEEGILVPVCLPLDAMEVFVKQLQMMLTAARTTSDFNKSAL